MVRNQSYFDPPLHRDTYLRVRGFAADGTRSGGIIDPKIVRLPAGMVLIRLYHIKDRWLGEWWSSPYELKQIIRHFARSDVFSQGRQDGKGVLHATLVVRHDWAGNDPRHLSRLVVVRLKDQLAAYFGEGDVAPDSSQTSVQKGMYIQDSNNKFRLSRQIFIPKPWEYPGAFDVWGHHSTDTHLVGAVERHRRAPLSFEV